MTIDINTQLRLIINHLVELKTNMQNMEKRFIEIEKSVSGQKVAVAIYGTLAAAAVAAIISSFF